MSDKPWTAFNNKEHVDGTLADKVLRDEVSTGQSVAGRSISGRNVTGQNDGTCIGVSKATNNLG